MHNFITEFKAFAIKGNVVDLATAVVIGTAFGTIVSSLVANIITPMIGILMGGVDFTGLKFSLGNSDVTYGVFIQSVVNFIVISLVVFLAIKLLARLKKNEVQKLAVPKEPSDEVKLLTEIRDSLRR